jgi:NAD(P)H-hydrate epimerase
LIYCCTKSKQYQMSKIRLLSQKMAKELDAELMGSIVAFTNEQLMELAGLSCALVVVKCYPKAKKCLVLAGPGNNGGDALVAARHLAHFNVGCDIYLPKRKKEGHLDLLAKQCEALNQRFVGDLSSIGSYDVILDGIFGFSFDAKDGIRAPFDTAIAAVNEAPSVPVVAVDVPSGWHVEDGNTSKKGMRCDVLVSLTAPKACARFHQGRHFLGGRFVPPSLQRKYELNLPEYPGTEQFVELPQSKL